jgi:hypothetical protein
VSAGTAHVNEGLESSRARDHEAWEPEWIEGRFICMLDCSCGEHIAVVGRQGVEQGFTGPPDDPEVDYYEFQEPLYFEPPLQLIEIHRQVPAHVAENLRQSFRLFWTDADAASNRIRQALEGLLDFYGVKRTVINKKRKRVELKLHARIEMFGRSGEPLSDHLMAVKWLGNAGSHPSTVVTRDDIFDAYEIMEFVLREKFDPLRERVGRLTKAINKSKKPRSASSPWFRVGRPKKR